MVAHAHNPSYSGGWGGRIVWTQEAEVVVSRTCPLLDSWRQQGSIDSQEMQKLYQDVEALVRKAYTPLMEQ